MDIRQVFDCKWGLAVSEGAAWLHFLTQAVISDAFDCLYPFPLNVGGGISLISPPPLDPFHLSPIASFSTYQA